MPWTFYNSNGQRLSTATTLIDNLDIDGATDIGGAIADADLFIIDDNAGGTNRKTAASRIATYIEGAFTAGAKVDLGSNLLVGNGCYTGIAISANGEVNMAAQPSVLAFNSGAATNVTGNGADYTLLYATEIYDQNADFASPTFTAPVTGRYLFTANCAAINITASATSVYLSIQASNRGHWSVEQDPTAGDLRKWISCIVDMDAADTATAHLVVYGESSDVVDIDAANRQAIAVHLLA